MRRIVTALSALLLLPSVASAQSGCTYERCALRIAPRLTGLAAVRDGGEELTSLNFLLPRAIAPAFALHGGLAGSDSAIMYADRAYATRRTAAVFTDLGIVLAGAAVGRAVSAHELRHSDAIVGGIGAVALAVSVPLQFAADDLLGKAVWWYNRRFAP